MCLVENSNLIMLTLFFSFQWNLILQQESLFYFNARFNELVKTSPKRIRAALLGEPSDRPLVIAGPSSIAKSIDIELNTQLLLPKDSVYDTTQLRLVKKIKNASLFEPTKVGVTKVAAKGWASKIRVSREAYVGLSKFRYLEEC